MPVLRLRSLLFFLLLGGPGAKALQQEYFKPARIVSLPPPASVSLPEPVSSSIRRDLIGSLSRTPILLVPILAVESLALPVNAMYENAPVRDGTGPGPVTLSSGVIYEDIREGNGDEVVQGKRVNVQWVLKRSNGYFVDSSANNDGVPFIFTVGDPKGAIIGVDEGIRGMRVGGIRRIIIPPKLSYVDGVEDGKPGPVPVGFGPKQRIRRVMELLKDIPGEYIVVDVKATRVQ